MKERERRLGIREWGKKVEWRRGKKKKRKREERKRKEKKKNSTHTFEADFVVSFILNNNGLQRIDTLGANLTSINHFVKKKKERQ